MVSRSEELATSDFQGVSCATDANLLCARFLCLLAWREGNNSYVAESIFMLQRAQWPIFGLKWLISKISLSPIYELIARNAVVASAWAYDLRFSTSGHYNNPRRSSCCRGARVWGNHGASMRTKICCDLRAVAV